MSSVFDVILQQFCRGRLLYSVSSSANQIKHASLHSQRERGWALPYALELTISDVIAKFQGCELSQF